MHDSKRIGRIITEKVFAFEQDGCYENIRAAFFSSFKNDSLNAKSIDFITIFNVSTRLK